MNKIKDKVLTFLIQEKDNLWNDLEDILYMDFTKDTYTPLTQYEIDKINEIRKEILNVYTMIDRIGEI